MERVLPALGRVRPAVERRSPRMPDPEGSQPRDARSPVVTGGLATLLESLKIDSVFVDLEDSLERVTDMITVIGGSLKTVMVHWDNLSETDRTDLIARAQKRANEII